MAGHGFPFSFCRFLLPTRCALVLTIGTARYRYRIGTRYPHLRHGVGKLVLYGRVSQRMRECLI